MADLNFDATGVPEPEDFDLLPGGWYQAEIAESEIRDCNGGRLLSIQWRILGPTHGGRVVWDQLLVEHTSQKALDIARRRLAATVRACGRSSISRSEEIHGVPVEIRLGVRKSAEYGDRNEVKAVRAVGARAAGASTARPADRDEQLPF